MLTFLYLKTNSFICEIRNNTDYERLLISSMEVKLNNQACLVCLNESVVQINRCNINEE